MPLDARTEESTRNSRAGHEFLDLEPGKDAAPEETRGKLPQCWNSPTFEGAVG